MTATTPPLTAARVEEIKARHVRLSSDRRQFWTAAESAMVADIAALLAEVERLRTALELWARFVVTQHDQDWQKAVDATVALGEDSSHG